MKRFIRQGPLNIVDLKTGEKQSVVCFLFNDLLIYGRPHEMKVLTQTPRSKNFFEILSNFSLSLSQEVHFQGLDDHL